MFFNKLTLLYHLFFSTEHRYVFVGKFISRFSLKCSRRCKENNDEIGYRCEECVERGLLHFWCLIRTGVVRYLKTHQRVTKTSESSERLIKTYVTQMSFSVLEKSLQYNEGGRQSLKIWHNVTQVPADLWYNRETRHCCFLSVYLIITTGPTPDWNNCNKKTEHRI